MGMKKAVLLASLLLLVASSAMATSITGSIGFSGNTSLNGSTVATSTAVTNWGSTAVGSSTLSAGAAGTLTTLVAPWSFATASTITNFWTTSGGYSFDLSNSHVVSNSGGFLAVAGMGVLHHAGFSDTAYTWSFSTQDPNNGGTDFGFAFTTSESSAAVPEPGSLTLLGAGLAGLAGLIRRKK
jgi:PEP-CTERM motif